MKGSDGHMKPYAVTAVTTRGREYDDPYGDEGDPFVTDRRRVLHSVAFRRLQYKTQVFVTDTHDHFRTRLTHTLEVADICRWLCAALGVNPVVGESIALSHDLGHPPFGHAGEKALAGMMAEHGGFEHNAQSLRVVEYLEHPFPAFRGLNLTFEIRESLAKHCTIYDSPGEHPLADGTHAPLEGQIANLADRVAYDCHDLEDAIGAELVNRDDLRKVSLWAQAADAIDTRHTDLHLPAVRRPILDRLESMLLNDIADESHQRIASARIQTLDQVRDWDDELVGFSSVMQPRVAELETFLAQRIYRHRKVVETDTQAHQIIERLFKGYLKAPQRLPDRFTQRIEKQGLHRVICDYIAGMTDRFCRDEYKEKFAVDV